LHSGARQGASISSGQFKNLLEIIRYQVFHACDGPARLMAHSGQKEAANMSTAKEELSKLIQQQPDDSSSEEIVRELAFHIMIQRGLADTDAGRVRSNEDMGHRIRLWQG
jgi:predicted transcriptional regulator